MGPGGCAGGLDQAGTDWEKGAVEVSILCGRLCLVSPPHRAVPP